MNFSCQAEVFQLPHHRQYFFVGSNYMDTLNFYRRLYLLAFFAIVLSFVACDQTDNNAEPVHYIFLHGKNGIQDSFASKMFDSGLLYSERKKYMHARNCCLKADSASPNTPIILNELGNISAMTDNDSLTTSYFERALQADSNFMQTFSNYGCFLNGKSQYLQAKEILYLGLKRRPENDTDKRLVYLNLADCYAGLHQKAIALAYIDSAKIGLSEGNLYKQIIAFEKQLQSE